MRKVEQFSVFKQFFVAHLRKMLFTIMREIITHILYHVFISCIARKSVAWITHIDVVKFYLDKNLVCLLQMH